jgi:positive regulator of sigma E activity
MSAWRSGAGMYLVAALAFLVAGAVGLLGEPGLETAALVVLGAAFLVLALNSWSKKDETRTTGDSSR